MNFASRSVIYENPLGSFTFRKAGTLDILFYFSSEGRHTEDFPDARKIQQLQPSLNPRTRIPVASMLTIRPPLHLRPILETYFPKVSHYFSTLSFSVFEVSVFVSIDKYRIKDIQFSLFLHTEC